MRECLVFLVHAKPKIALNTRKRVRERHTMIFFGALLLTIGVTSAFKASWNTRASLVTLGASLDGLVGSGAAEGCDNWDPLNLADEVSDETLDWYRAAELKHARICMLASLGLSVAPIWHLPDPVFDR